MGLTSLLPWELKQFLQGAWTPTPALIQLVEQLKQLRVHAVDGLEE